MNGTKYLYVNEHSLYVCGELPHTRKLCV